MLQHQGVSLNIVTVAMYDTEVVIAISYIHVGMLRSLSVNGLVVYVVILRLMYMHK